jgi:hypothetical protein
VERDDLDNLLRRADAATGAPPRASDLAGRVRRRREVRRRRRSLAAGGAAFAICLVAAVWQVGRLPGDVPRGGSSSVAVTGIVPPKLDTAAVRAEVAALQAQSRRHEAAAARFTAIERHRTATARARVRLAADVSTSPEWQREQAALVLVRQGDRLAGEMNLPASAAVAYRRASETFGGTHWADVARERLTNTNSN